MPGWYNLRDFEIMTVSSVSIEISFSNLKLPKNWVLSSIWLDKLRLIPWMAFKFAQ